ncbi:MAG: glutathione S-transferase N-terminal domain-containing protein [gamma proteobacterium symbiont of Bathyaustriella thionipta]|nr:glutathione S-transferase N-terminal domain-containing protein [gamma proteobacterium symbiont of Bathyaustriella thionipta]
MKAVRWILGKLILAYEWAFKPRKGPQRSEQEQQRVARETAGLSLYQLPACPFCVKVRFTESRLGLDIEKRNVKSNPQYMEELVQQGGVYKVPCLRIPREGEEDRWLYESSDIVDYLKRHYSISSQTNP